MEVGGRCEEACGSTQTAPRCRCCQRARAFAASSSRLRGAAFVTRSGCREGALLVFVNGSTASVSTIEYEPGLVQDITDALSRLFPPGQDYAHHKTWNDGNGYAHIMATVMKPSVTVPIRNTQLVLGTWQQIILMDFDNKPRQREVVLQVLASG